MVEDLQHASAISVLSEGARYSLRIADPDAATAALGFDLPATIGATTNGQGWSAIALGPEEWMLMAQDGADAPGPIEAPHSLVDISDRERIIEVAGSGACAAIAAGCPRDLTALKAGHGFRSVFNSVPILLLCRAADRYEIHVRRSYMPHILRLLTAVQNEQASGL